MANYLLMSKEDLLAEQVKLQTAYDEYVSKGLKLDMSRGKPDSSQLDLSLGLMTVDAYIDEDGVDTRNYGNLEGCPESRRFFADMLGAKVEETFVGGNSSLQLMYNAIDYGYKMGFDGCTPWKDCEKIKFLCPAPGYDRHFRITEAFGFELLLVPMTPDGPDMDVVEELVKDEAVKGIWCIPVYSNPDGYVYSSETVDRMAKMETAAQDFRVFWDNAYLVHHLTDQHLTCPNILDECRKHGNENRPIMFCSTSKITFAGAGVGALAASKQNTNAIGQFMFAMTIGFDKVNQLRHVRFLKQVGGVAAQMDRHAEIIRPKFEIVLNILNKNLTGCGEIATWTTPMGGYFISFNTMDGCAKRVVELCKNAGVVLTGAGAAFPYGIDPNDRHIRIAPTFPPLSELEIAAELLTTATRLATVEKLLAS